MSFIRIYEENPDPSRIAEVVDCLKRGGVIVYPTDTVYGLGCDIYNKKAMEKVAQLKGIKPNKAKFSFICSDMSEVAEYSRQINTSTFKLMRKALPGPYTFILPAASIVPKHIQSNKKNVGIRVPHNNIAIELVRALGNPIMSTSIRDEDEIIEYTTDPELIYERFRDKVDLVINGGYGNNEASTVIDLTGSTPEIIREGIGDADLFRS